MCFPQEQDTACPQRVVAFEGKDCGAARLEVKACYAPRVSRLGNKVPAGISLGSFVRNVEPPSSPIGSSLDPEVAGACLKFQKLRSCRR